MAICTTEAEARRKISTLRCSSAVRSPATSGAVGTMSSVRFTLLLTVILMIRVIMTFSTASGLRKELEGMPKPSIWVPAALSCFGISYLGLSLLPMFFAK